MFLFERISATADTCVAMSEWVERPSSNTALDEILPCTDNATAQETLMRSKEVTGQLVELINTVVSNVSNINFSPVFVQMYYNQSGPLLPLLCNPFNHDLTDRPCSPGELDLNNATQVSPSSCLFFLLAFMISKYVFMTTGMDPFCVPSKPERDLHNNREAHAGAVWSDGIMREHQHRVDQRRAVLGSASGLFIRKADL